MRRKSRAKKMLRTIGVRRPRPPWVVDEEQPAADPLAASSLYAIVAEWELTNGVRR